MNSNDLAKAKELLKECRPIFANDCSNDSYSARGREAAAKALHVLDSALLSRAESDAMEDVFLNACVLTSVAGSSVRMRGLARRVRAFSERRFPSAFSPATPKPLRSLVSDAIRPRDEIAAKTPDIWDVEGER